MVVEQFRALFYPCVHFVERDASRSLLFIFITSFCVSSRSLGVLAICRICRGGGARPPQVPADPLEEVGDVDFQDVFVVAMVDGVLQVELVDSRSGH